MFLAMSVEPKTMSAIANDQGKKTMLNEWLSIFNMSYIWAILVILEQYWQTYTTSKSGAGILLLF